MNLSELNKQMSGASGYTMLSDPVMSDSTPSSQPVYRYRCESGFPFSKKEEQSDKPFRKAAEVNFNQRPVYKYDGSSKHSSNSAQVLESGDHVQMVKGRKSPTFGCKPTERDIVLSHKGSSPGVASGKTQASTLYNGTSSDLSGNNKFQRFGKPSA